MGNTLLMEDFVGGPDDSRGGETSADPNHETRNPLKVELQPEAREDVRLIQLVADLLLQGERAQTDTGTLRSKGGEELGVRECFNVTCNGVCLSAPIKALHATSLCTGL